jgi:chemotaxis protein methyltransferase CheR
MSAPTSIEPQTSDEREASAVRRIRAAIRQARGVDLAHYRRSFLRRRLAVRQRARAAADLSAYAAILARDPAEIDALLRALTINVTEFFRNPDLFHLLESRVIGGLARDARAERRRLRVWCAGCASGEEVYSLAILLDRLGLGRHEATLSGTDVDPEAVAAARAGTFEASRLREVKPEIRDAYFEPGPGPRQWSVRAARLAPVRFRAHDLQSPSLHRGQDLVLCRNVLIYFERPIQLTLFERFHESLVPGGYLQLGKVETLFGATSGLFTTVSARERLFHRP